MSHSQDGQPQNVQRQQKRVLKLMLIEDDPVFRLGLLACLEPIADIQIVLDADSPALALQQLRDLANAREPIAPAPANALPAARSLDLILLNLDLGQASASQGMGLTLCQQLRTQHSQFPLLLLGSTLELTRLAAAFQSGAGGYCLKGTSVAELVTAIRQVAAGQSYWTDGIQAIAQPSNITQLDAGQLADRSLIDASPGNRRSIEPATNPTIWTVWRRNIRLSGVRQIDRAIAELEVQLQTSDRSVVDQLILAGQRRELRTARWLVNRLLKLSHEPVPPPAPLPEGRRSPAPDRQPPNPTITPDPSRESPAALATTIASSIQSPQAALFQTTGVKLQTSLQNLTSTALEIDILKDAKKRELLLTVLRKLQETVESLRLSQVSIDQLSMRHGSILQDVWQAAVTDFFGKYYTLQVETQPIDLVDHLLQDADIVQTEILDKIPLFPEFLSHLLFQIPLTIDDADYAAGTVEAMARMELLLQHTIIQIANATMQPLLNRFGNVIAIKQTFYDKRLLSSRDIERFRNELSWHYRTDRLFTEPAAIFESRYNLLTLTGNGISNTAIYAPRNEALAQLSGLAFLVTLALEARDAIAPRVRAAVSFLGRGVVYVLTEIIGRGIGLIGRGMIKGIGNALQETKPKRRRDRTL